jgi:hypothetical protein
MKIRHIALISAALSIATALGAAPGTGAKPKKPATADLATQRVTMAQQYVVVKPNGKTTHPISVTVSIRNIGHAAAPPSETDVRLFSNGHKIASETIPLARLAPGHASTQIALFPDAEPQLGFIDAQAIADSTIKVSGPTNNDFKRSPERPVIAQRWTGSMESEVHTPGIIKWDEDDDAKTGVDVAFRFSRLDALHRFVYTVGGTVKQTASFTGQGCTGGGETSASMARWGKDSGLYLSQDLTQYEAVIRGSLGPPFTVDVTCPDSPQATPVRIVMKDLLTEASIGSLRQPMRPAARVLGDMGTLGSLITVTNSWHLVADVP